MRLDVKKCCACRDIEDVEDNKDMTPQEKLKDFFEDHSDMCGCLFSLTILGILVGSVYGINNYIQQKKCEEKIACQRAEKTAKEMEELFIQKLFSLSNKITKKNVVSAMKVAKYLVLMERSSADERGLDLLVKKYCDLHQKSKNNVVFQDLLLQRQETLANNHIAPRDNKQPTPVLIRETEQPYTQVILKEKQQEHIK